MAVCRWADQFSNLDFHDEAQGWADKFEAQSGGHAFNVEDLFHKGPGGNPLNAIHKAPPSKEWLAEYESIRSQAARDATSPTEQWADEFGTSQMQAAGPSEKQATDRADALQQTKALRDTLASSQDPKFQQSKFLQFVSKMSRGEIILEDNKVWMSSSLLCKMLALQ